MPVPVPVPVEAVPYLDLSELHGRTVVVMSLWDGAGWHTWVPAPHGLLIPMRPLDAGHSNYVARSAARDDDLHIPFVDLMWQRATWGDITPRLSAVQEDFHHLFSSAAKLRFFHRHRERLPALEASGFLMTELEYVSTTARSVFDLVHEAISLIWRRHVRLIEPSADRRRRERQLPRSFAAMVGSDGALVTSAELQERYALPQALADAYERQRPFFARLRHLRDGVVHGLGRSPRVYLTPRGFAVERAEPAFSELVVWRDSDAYNEPLVSVLPLLARLVLATIDACNDLVASLAAQIVLPPPLAPGYCVFLRTPHSRVGLELLAAARGELSWWPDEEGAG